MEEQKIPVQIEKNESNISWMVNPKEDNTLLSGILEPQFVQTEEYQEPSRGNLIQKQENAQNKSRNIGCKEDLVLESERERNGELVDNRTPSFSFHSNISFQSN